MPSEHSLSFFNHEESPWSRVLFVKRKASSDRPACSEGQHEVPSQSSATFFVGVFGYKSVGTLTWHFKCIVNALEVTSQTAAAHGVVAKKAVMGVTRTTIDSVEWLADWLVPQRLGGERACVERPFCVRAALLLFVGFEEALYRSRNSHGAGVFRLLAQGLVLLKLHHWIMKMNPDSISFGAR
ncbi:hypothetical protein MRX96_042150 [Rhipicephalus microplus]